MSTQRGRTGKLRNGDPAKVGQLEKMRKMRKMRKMAKCAKCHKHPQRHDAQALRPAHASDMLSVPVRACFSPHWLACGRPVVSLFILPPLGGPEERQVNGEYRNGPGKKEQTRLQPETCGTPQISAISRAPLKVPAKMLPKVASTVEPRAGTLRLCGHAQHFLGLFRAPVALGSLSGIYVILCIMLIF